MRNKRLTMKILAAAVMLLACFALTACRPVLSLNPEYSYTEFELELGHSMPAEAEEYIDFSALSEEDAEFVRDNTEILFDGEPAAESKAFSHAGVHTVTIKYCGHQYRKYTVNVTDSVPPEFTKARDVYTFVSLPLSDDVTRKMFKAKDNSGEVEVAVSDSEVDYYKAGKYAVTAVATDPSGNEAEAKAYIVVQEPAYGAMGTYVFVSISKQHMTYFRNGKAVMDSPVVTGNPYNGHSTPRGTFTLNYKSRNTKLVGTEDNGDKYESFVNYWMAFIGSSVGLHDATWRSNFGGNIYQGGGSHGCVNMPLSAAAQLYDLIEPGTPVLVY